MDIQQYINQMKEIQNVFISFIEDEDDSNQSFHQFMKLFDDNIRENQYELKTFLHLLVTISNHHYRNSEFFNKINQILQNIQDIIKKYFPNFQKQQETSSFSN